MLLTIDNPKSEKILKAPCKKVKDFKSVDHIILCQELKYMASQDNAAGIAAPQIGRNLKAFAISTNKKVPPVLVFNPVVISLSNEISEVYEGCLSIPGKVFKLIRHDTIEITWQDEFGEKQNKNGKLYKATFAGFEAQVIQHETDHTDSMLCCDQALETYTLDEFNKMKEKLK